MAGDALRRRSRALSFILPAVGVPWRHGTPPFAGKAWTSMVNNDDYIMKTWKSMVNNDNYIMVILNGSPYEQTTQFVASCLLQRRPF